MAFYLKKLLFINDKKGKGPCVPCLGTLLDYSLLLFKMIITKTQVIYLLGLQ